MSQQIVRRMRRKKTSSTDISLDEELPRSGSTELSEPFIKQNVDDISDSAPPSNHRSRAINNSYLNHIRAELLEDNHHSEFTESNYSDDTHDWGWDSQQISDDYWHFLGRYE